MKKHTIVFVVLLICLLLASFVVDAQQRGVEVFRDLAWGDSVDVLGNSRVFKDEGAFMEYERRRENMSLGSVSARVIRYGFFGDRLFRITVIADDNQPLDRLVRARYGTPDFDLPMITLWNDLTTDTKISYGEQQGYKIMILTSISIGERYDAWKKKKEQEAAQSAW